MDGAKPIDVDILIRGGTLLTMSDAMEVVENPVIAVKDGKILLAAEAGPSAGPFRAAETIDAVHSIILPGLVNTHTHLPMVCFRGLADDLPLMAWLNDHIFPAEAKAVNREMVYRGSLLAIAEMILSGTTTFCDGYFYESSVAAAAMESGMRAVAAQGFIDRPAGQPGGPGENAGVAERFVEKWSGRSPMVTPALFCHSPYTCSPATLKSVKEVARASGVPFLLHLAETRDETGIIRERYGAAPVSHLLALGVLDESTVAVHCVWLEPGEIGILADRGVKVSHNPESNMKLASGVAPVPEMLRRGITIGLGTDGSASNNDLDLFGEMATAARLHKVARMDPTAMDAKTVLRMATIEGARALGLGGQIGSIEAGKEADIIVLDTRKPHLTPLYNPYSHIVYSAGGADVSTAIIGGKIVMRDRKLLTLDSCKVMDGVREIADRIRKMGSI